MMVIPKADRLLVRRCACRQILTCKSSRWRILNVSTSGVVYAIAAVAAEIVANEEPRTALAAVSIRSKFGCFNNSWNRSRTNAEIWNDFESALRWSADLFTRRQNQHHPKHNEQNPKRRDDESQPV